MQRTVTGTGEAHVLRRIRGMLVVALLAWCCLPTKGSQIGEMKRVETPFLTWRDGEELGEGEKFYNGDSLLFEKECYVVIFDHVTCGRVEVAEGAIVTMTPTGGGVSAEEVVLNGTLVFHAPWETVMDWKITAGQHGLIVMDLSTFSGQELCDALPGEYHGRIELRSGQFTATREHGAEKLSFKEVQVKDGAQLGLLSGASYTGDMVLAGRGWINDGKQGSEGALLMESDEGNDATLNGRLTLAGDTVFNVRRAGDTGRITSELHAQGYAIVKAGEGDLQLEGEVVTAPSAVEVRDGRLTILQGWDAMGGRLVTTGAGTLTLHGSITGLREWSMMDAHVELYGAYVAAKRMTGSGTLLVQDSTVNVGALQDFTGEITLHNSTLEIGVGEETHLRSMTVDEASTLRAELCSGNLNSTFHADEVHFESGSHIELGINLSKDMILCSDSSGHGVVEGDLYFANDCVLGLQVERADAYTGNERGLYQEFVLAEHAEGLPQLDHNTQVLLRKYFGDTAQLRNEDGRLMLSGVFRTLQNEDFHQQAARSFNGHAGALLLDAMFAGINPQSSAPHSDRAAILHAQENLIEHGMYEESDRMSAAVIGASIPALMLALQGQFQTSLETLAAEARSCGFASTGSDNWGVETFGGCTRLDGQGTDSGYALNTWGGRVGMVHRGRKTVVGLRLEARYGDWDARDVDTAGGELGLYSFGVYCNINSDAWVQHFLVQVGVAEVNINRQVFMQERSYKTEGKTQGMVGGLVYEMSRGIQERNGVVIFHTAVWGSELMGYNEKGSDAALRVGQGVIWGMELGAGVQHFGQVCMAGKCGKWELGGMLLADLGVREVKMHCGFLYGTAQQAYVRSQRLSWYAARLNASMSINLDHGELKVQLAAELRRRSESISACLGYTCDF